MTDVRQQMLTSGSVLSEILGERLRQIHVEKHNPLNDYSRLASAAAAYALSADQDIQARKFWPWASHVLRHAFKPTTPRRDLIKAAALIVAEIERLDRQKD